MFSLCIQDWKTGDRILAKWQDCKFYPAKITKCLSDGKNFLITFQGLRLTFQLASLVASERFDLLAKTNFSLARHRHLLR